MLLFEFWIWSIAKRGDRARHVDKPDTQVVMQVFGQCRQRQHWWQVSSAEVQGLEHLSCKGILRDRPASAWRREDLGASQSSLSHLWTGHCVDRARLFIAVHGSRTRDNTCELKQEKFTLGIRENVFCMRTIQQMISWHPFQVELSSDPMKS